MVEKNAVGGRADRTLILALRGFSIPQKTYLHTVLELASCDDIGWWQLGEPANSDAVLLNADSLNENGENRSANLMSALPIEVMCSAFAAEESEQCGLQLPLSYSRIVALLGKLYRQLQHSAENSDVSVQSVANMPTLSLADVTPLPDQFRRTRSFYEETRLLGLLRELIDQGQPVEIHHPRFTTLRLYPRQGLFESESSDVLIPAMFRTLVVEFSTSSLDRDPTPWHGLAKQPLWRLVFLAALYGSEGRLHKHLNQDDKLELLSAVDFTIVPEALAYQPIANYLRNGDAASVNQIAARVGVRVEKVIDFCNACEEVFLLHCTPAIATVSNANITSSATTRITVDG